MFHWNYNSVLTKTTWEDTAMESGVCLLIKTQNYAVFVTSRFF